MSIITYTGVDFQILPLGGLDFTGAVELIIQGPGKLVIQNEAVDMSSGTPFYINGGLRLDWGDGSPPFEGAGWEEHTYGEGEFHARVRFEKLPPVTINRCNIGGEALVGISQWGDPEHLATPLTLIPTSLYTGETSPGVNFAQVPDHSPPPMMYLNPSSGAGVEELSPSLLSFSGSEMFNQDISGWDVTKYESLYGLFSQCEEFNQDISSWDVSNIKTMMVMFANASSFNQDISGWDVSSVVNMSYMFYSASSFDQDLSGWCVANIPSEPELFSLESGLAPEHHPVWGTCPSNE